MNTTGPALSLHNRQQGEAVLVINALVDIPWVPEALEAELIEFAINAIVGAFNKKFGKDWLSKIV